MKTKNIFRTLLMAAFLLAGANNVKAVTLPYNDANGSDNVDINFGEFDSAEVGDILRVTCEITNYGNEWWHPEWKFTISGNGNYITEIPVTENGAVDVVLTSTILSGINTTDQYNRSMNLQGSFVKFTKIELIRSGVTTYSVSVSESTNGLLSISPTTDVAAGTTVTITATPSEGYKLSTIAVTGADETNVEVSGSGNTRTFVMPEQNVTVSATFAEIETVEATITSSTGFATFCSDKALDFTGISTIEAYYAKTVENGNVYLLRVYGTVKAGTGLVIKGSTTRIPVADSGDDLDGNMLVGVSSETSVNASTDYVLTVKNDVAVFAQTGANAATVAAGHAYLRVPVAQARTRTIGIGGEGTTGIDNTFIDDCEQGEMVIYNLSGLRVKSPTKGLFIINGKKKILK